MHAVVRKEIDKLETPWSTIAHYCSSDGNKDFKQKKKNRIPKMWELVSTIEGLLLLLWLHDFPGPTPVDQALAQSTTHNKYL